MEVPGYKLGRLYDNGEYCRSYSALNLNNHKTVNIQVFNPSLAANQTFLSQFKMLTSKLVGSKFGIMSSFLRSEITDRACYVTSEHYSYPQKTPSTTLNLTRQQVIKFAVQIAQTLDELHKIGVVHGGIELTSLCFESQDLLVLRPPSLQRVITVLRPISFKSLTSAQRQYLAPEANRELTPATDFYALGVLLYQLLYGHNSYNVRDAKSLKENISKDVDRDLEYLLQHLLAKEVDKRIQNYDQFKDILQKCGVELPENEAPSTNETSDHQLKSEKLKASSSTDSKWFLPAAGVTSVALAGLFLVSLAPENMQPQSQSVDTRRVVTSKTTDVGAKAAEQTSTIAKTESQETSIGFNKLYQQALDQIETNPETALRIINVALKKNPDNNDAINLIKRIEQQIEIDLLFEDVEIQLKEVQLLTPKGDNAFETYQTLAKMLSPDDQRVSNGFTRITAAYYALSENELLNNQLEKALEYAELGLSIKADYPKLVELRRNIIERQRLSDHELHLAKQDRAQQVRDLQLTNSLIQNQAKQINKTEHSASQLESK
ncbi:MAG: protein kinase [Candidatus Thiodiazotropha sp. DIVDIV]